MSASELIVMLTQNDLTIGNAAEIFAACKDTPVRYWGMKEKGLPPEQMKQLYDAIHSQGKTGVLEVVAYTEEECLQGAYLAAQCGCDMLLGTLYFDSVRDFCQAQNIRYMPFVGQVSGRPSVLEGSIADMASQAAAYVEKGAYGIDLLGYRYQGDAAALSRAVIASGVPVCLAGNIDSFEKLDQVRALRPAFFTIGSAFWAHQFGDDPEQQIRKVCRYIQDPILV